MTIYVSAMFPLIITDGAAGFDQIERENLTSLVNQHLEMVLYTRPGEIISDIMFGIGIEDYLFANEREVRVLKLRSNIEGQISKYMSYLTTFSVLIDRTNIHKNSLGIQIKYAIDNLNVDEVVEFIVLP